MTVLLARACIVVGCLFASSLWAQNKITLEFLPGLGANGREPRAAIVQAPDGALYGSTTKGGTHDNGTLFRVIPGANPTVKTLYSFDEETYSPAAPMVLASDGRLYGVTNVWKKLYRLTPQSSPAVKLFELSFEGSNKAGDVLTEGSDHALYAPIDGSQGDPGGIYRITLQSTPNLKRVWSFRKDVCSATKKPSNDQRDTGKEVAGRIVVITDRCSVSHGALVAAGDGNLYGAATWTTDDDRHGGFVYRVIPRVPIQVEILRTYEGKDRASEITSLVAAKNGNLYGTTLADGARGLGTVFVIETGAQPKIRTIQSIQSQEFRGSKLLAAQSGGRLYGVSRGDPRSCGSVFVLTLGGAPVMKTLLSFTSGQTNVDPNRCTYDPGAATFSAGPRATLYGTLAPQGFYAHPGDAPGEIFRITTGPNPSAAELLSFTSEVGYVPIAPLVVARDGNIYGTTTKGAAMEQGSVFQFKPAASKFTNLLSFSPEKDIEVRSALTVGGDGKLYGIGTLCCGSVGIAFRVDGGSNPSAKTLHRFESGYSDGGPYGSPIAGIDGQLYGLMPYGGKSYLGGIYRITTGDTPAVSAIYDFRAATGSKPYAQLVSDGKGHFYGATREDGRFGAGSIFRVTPGGKELVSLLDSFDKKLGTPDESALLLAKDTYLYGTTSNNEPRRCGSIFRIATDHAAKIEVVHMFDVSECSHPSGLVAASDGSIYLAARGSASDQPAKILRVSIGKQPSVATVGSLNQYSNMKLYPSSDGDLYGVADGPDGRGVIFPINTGPNPRIGAPHSFDNKLWPDSLVPGSDGNLYGTSVGGGSHGKGAIVSYRPGSDALELLYSFGREPDGAPPSTPLIEHDGYLYGVTLDSNMLATGLGGTGRVFRFRLPKMH